MATKSRPCPHTITNLLEETKQIMSTRTIPMAQAIATRAELIEAKVKLYRLLLKLNPDEYTEIDANLVDELARDGDIQWLLKR